MKRILYFGIAGLLSALSVIGQTDTRTLNPIEKQKLQLPQLPTTQTRTSTPRSAGSVDYTKGTFFVNEDWYGHQNSSVNYLTESGTWAYNVFQSENPGHELGCTSQFGTIYGEKFYIVSKQDKDLGATITGSRLVVCDAKTMKVIKEFKNIASNANGKSIADGRSFLGVDEHTGYIGTNSGIYIYDIDKMEIKDQVAGTENATGGLYTGQIGTMVRAGNKVFAVHQKAGLLVINPFEHKVDTVILTPENGMGLGSIVLSKDGTIWASIAQVSGSGGTQPYIWKIDPSTLKTVKVAIPTNEGIEEISNSWYAWTADGFCASTKENKIYWKGQGAGSWFTGYAIFCYDIDTQAFYKVFDFSKLEGDWRLYGTGFRIDPVTDEMYCFLYHEFLNPEHLVMRIATNGRGETNGTVKGRYPYEKVNYWFPALPVFPDNEVPVVSSKLPSIITFNEEKNIYDESLNDILQDNDNLVSAVVTTISNDKPELIKADVLNNRLTITPIKEVEEPSEINLSFRFNSNGRIVEHAMKVTLNKTSLPFYLNKRELTLISNEKQEYLNISCMEGETVIWSSDDEQVATVDNGMITTHTPGTAKIIAKSETRENTSDTCIVTVKEYISTTLVETITFVDAPTTIKLGETIKLKVSVSPENASNKDVTWSCKTPNIVSVSSEGEITGLKTGSSTDVVATAKDGSKKEVKLRIKCVGPEVTNISLEDTLYGAKLGAKSITIPLLYAPVNADKTSFKLEKSVFTNNVTPTGWAPTISSGNIRITVAKNNIQTSVDTKATFTLTDGTNKHEFTCRIVYTSWIKSFSIDEHEKTVKPEDTYNIAEHITIDRGDFNETEKPIVYSSSDEKVISVTETGEVTAIAPGIAIVTARIPDGSYKEQIEFTVLGNSLAKSITLSEKKVKLLVGESHQLTANVDEDASIKAIKWKSEYPEQVSVTSNGEVLVSKAGRLNIIASSADGAVSDTCIIEAGIPLERIEISPKELVLDKADASNGIWDIFKLTTMTYYPNNASVITANQAQGAIKSVTASNTIVISKAEINMYSPFLKLSAGETGSSYLVLETKESGIKDSMLIRVTDRTSGITGVTLETKKTVTTGDYFTIQATIKTTEPEDSEIDKSLIWETDKEELLTIDKNGRFLAKKQGITFVRATTKVGGFTATCQVVVEDPAPIPPVIHVSGVSLNESLLALKKGETAVLTALVTPSNAENREVSWYSSNTAVASVSGGAVIAGIAGTATITVTTNDGDYTATCEINVTDPDLDKPVVEAKDSTATLTFPKVEEATKYEVSVYKYINSIPVLFGVYTTDAEGTIITGLRSNLRADSPVHIAISLQQLDNNAKYIVKITAVKEKDGKTEFLGTFFSEPFTTTNTVDNEQIGSVKQSISYSNQNLYLANLEQFTCYIITLSGNIQKRIEVTAPEEKHSLYLPKGVYIVTAIKDDKRISQKIRINN